MADTQGQIDIRGINVDKAIKGFADEDLVMKQFCLQTPTSARLVRWYQKTAGFLSTTDTTGMTASRLEVADNTLPECVGPSFTRNASYVKKWMVESEWISNEDMADSDVDVWLTTIRDLTRAVGYDVETHIINTLVESYSASNIQSFTATADGWDDEATGDITKDLMQAKRMIRQYSYNPEGAVLLINSIEHEFLLRHYINVKGSSVPAFSSEKVRSGVVMEILGLRVVVSENFTTDYACVFVPQRAITYKTFKPLRSAVIDNPLIGKKIRIAENGIALLTDPKAVVLIDDTTV